MSQLLIWIGVILIIYCGIQIFTYKWNSTEELHHAQKILTEQKKHIDKQPDSIRFSPNEGDVIGILKAPSIQLKVPILEGTDKIQLSKGIGHHIKTAFPGQMKQILLSGHNDSSLRTIGQLKKGDELTVEMPYGEFHYVMTKSKIVHADDRTVVDLSSKHETLLLSTCYPFHTIGQTSQRYVLYAKKQQ
ncbi:MULTISPECIES: class D sortase [Bacillus]|uniref:class D sortase n=1 Tax=Bacillus safensis TaxID=561879 RepID=UPI002E220EB8|nr:class D sortase [Bacillus safensis]